MRSEVGNRDPLDIRCLGSNIRCHDSEIDAPAADARRKGVSAHPGDPTFYRGDDYRIDESIGYLLRQLRIQMDRAIDAEMTEHDLTGVQWGPSARDRLRPRGHRG